MLPIIDNHSYHNNQGVVSLVLFSLVFSCWVIVSSPSVVVIVNPVKRRWIATTIRTAWSAILCNFIAWSNEIREHPMVENSIYEPMHTLWHQLLKEVASLLMRFILVLNFLLCAGSKIVVYCYIKCNWYIKVIFWINNCFALLEQARFQWCHLSYL